MSTGDDRDFLSRWSRRKRGEAVEAPVGEAAEPEAPGAGELTDEELLAEHGLPDPDALRPGDDIRGFMARGIPHRLRNRALRKLWTGNPVLANLDELVDYGEDFTDAARVVENLATGWAVGRGYLKAEVEPPRQEVPSAAGPEGPEAEAPTSAGAGTASGPASGDEPGAAEAAGATETTGATETIETTGTAEASEADPPLTAAELPQAPEVPRERSGEPVPRLRRRMRFT